MTKRRKTRLRIAGTLCLYALASIGAIASSGFCEMATRTEDLKPSRKSVFQGPRIHSKSGSACFASVDSSVAIDVIQFHDVRVGVSATGAASSVPVDDSLSKFPVYLGFVGSADYASDATSGHRMFSALTHAGFNTSPPARSTALSAALTCFSAGSSFAPAKAQAARKSGLANNHRGFALAYQAGIASLATDNLWASAIAKPQRAVVGVSFLLLIETRLTKLLAWRWDLSTPKTEVVCFTMLLLWPDSGSHDDYSNAYSSSAQVKGVAA